MAATSREIKEDAIPSRIGRDEMNLSELPIALLADRAPKGLTSLYFKATVGGLTVTGAGGFGLPTAADTDVLLALLYLTKQRNNFTDTKVNFSRYELIKLLNWHDVGASYKRIDESFNRWGGVWLVYDKCWWNNKSKKYVSAKMHIIETVVFADAGGNRKNGQAHLPLSTFVWNETFIESCQADNLRQLNLDEYFSLKSAIAKRLYRFLGKRFYLQGDWTFDLNEIAFDRIGLTRAYEHNAGKVKEKLQPAIEELEAIGFLRPLSREERYTRIDRGHWTIRLTRQNTVHAKPKPALPFAEPPSLLAELTNRKVTSKGAALLLKRHAADYIKDKIEEFDFEMAGPKPPAKPAGWLVASINDNYPRPESFVSRADRERQAEVAHQANEKNAEKRRRERQEEADHRARCQEEDAWWANLAAEERVKHDAKALAAASPSMRETHLSMKRHGSADGYLWAIRRVYIRSCLDAENPVDAE